MECYDAYKNKPTGEVLEEWDLLNISDFIFNMYEMYHSESIENAFKDIDSDKIKCKEGVGVCLVAHAKVCP